MTPKKKYKYYLVIAFDENGEVLYYHEEYAASPEHARELARPVHYSKIREVEIGSVKVFPSRYLWYI